MTVSNAAGNATSSAAVLTVDYAPSITTAPQAQTVNQGATATFTVAASGNPAPTYQWRKNSTPISNATNTTLSLTNVQTGDAASYDVVATNSVSSATSTAVALTVVLTPAITTQPSPTTVTAGQPASFSVVASGTTPLTYVWKRGSSTLADGGAISGSSTATLSLSTTLAADNGASFTVTVSNPAGNVTSNAAVLTVNVGPAFTTSPTSQTVNQGQSATFIAVATGNPAPTYQWRKNTSAIGGATNSTLTLTNVQAADGASYDVVATNSITSATSNAATLTVNVPPAITTQPTAVTVNAGQPASFSVVATGAPAPTYQWRKGGSAISGATGATLAIASALFSDSGNYDVVVTNAAGAATSNAVALTVNAPPSITSQPVNFVGVVGGSATFTVVATGSTPFTYQWSKGSSAISGATNATLVLTGLAKADAGSYSVVVTNGYGSATSSAATLAVNDATAAVVITGQPSGSTVLQGQPVTFNVVATGIPTPTYQWYKGGVPISGAISSSYFIGSAQVTDAGTYSVVVTNSVNAVTSTQAALVVNATPAITAQPVSATVNSGQSATFTVTATGSPAPTYQWRKNTGTISGATLATLALSNVQGSDAAAYDVVVTNAVGSVTSNAATLTVNVAPTITTQPANLSVTVGQSATFSVVAGGTPAPTFQWLKNGVAISGATIATLTLSGVQQSDAAGYAVVVTNVAGTVTSTSATLSLGGSPSITSQPANVAVTLGQTATFTVVAGGTPAPTYQWRKNGASIGGATSATLTLSNVQAGDAASYDVVVTNVAGTVTSSAATLSVNGSPSITTQPVAVTVAVGQPATFTVVATGTPAPTYQWRKNSSPIAGATAATLTIASSQTSDGGSYDVVVTNAGGSVTSSAVVLTVSQPNSPVINTQPVDETVVTGASVVFTVSATSASSLTYQWRKNGTAIGTATLASLAISNVQTGDAGSYDIVVTNANGSATSSVANLRVLTTAAPTIIVQPVGRSVATGTDITFSVTATGNPTPSYQWRKNATAISGAVGANLFLSAVQTGDAGSYDVVVSNSVGSVTSTAASLNVTSALVAPRIVQQPASFSVLQGQSATLVVTATGNPAPTYQWRRNAQPVTGATSATLVLGNVQSSDSGSYDVVVTNSQGVATSALSRLTVTTAATAPVILSQPSSQTTLLGRTITLAVVASGVPTPSFQWSKGSTPISGATMSTLTLANIQVSDAGNYAATVSNSAGSITSAGAAITVLKKSYAGTYFGSYGPGLGSFAMYIREDNTGIFLSYSPGAGFAAFSQNVAVDDAGHFTFTASAAASTSVSLLATDGGPNRVPQAAVAPLLLDFVIGDNGLVAGTVSGLAGAQLSASKADTSGATAAVAGFFQSSVAGGAATTTTIVGPGGQAFVFTQTATGTDAGAGTVDVTGKIAVTTANHQTIVATVAPDASSIVATVTDPQGNQTTYAGATDAVIASQRLYNLSTRARVGTGDAVAIAGFVVAGVDSKPLLIRAVGPGLAAFGVGGTVANPTLTLMRGNTVVTANTGWTTAGNAAEIAAAAARAGAFPLDLNSTDSVIYTTLAPGAYTAIVAGANNTVGVALVEIYDLSVPAPGDKLINLSTRAVAGTGDNILTAGVYIVGSVPKRVLLRAVGPGLTPFGVTGVLAQPQIILYSGGQIMTKTTGGWSAGADAASLAAAAAQVGAFALPAGSLDAAIIVSLPPGAYTAQVVGLDNASGNALIEVYELP